jgi:hypothetical protein
MSVFAYDREGVARSLGFLGAFLMIAGLSGCVTRQAAVPPPGHAAPTRLVPSPRLGQPFDVVPTESHLTVLVYRAGPLAALGHDHVIACRCLAGTLYLPRDPRRASFDLRVAVAQFIVDDPAARASQHSADFPPDVPESARQGTRHNMLGEALLNAAKYPYIGLRSAGLRPSSDREDNDIVADVLVQVAGQVHLISVPLHYAIGTDEIVVTGEFPLRQTDLGLTPFTVAGGALRVRNGIEVRLRLVARRRVG